MHAELQPLLDLSPAPEEAFYIKSTAASFKPADQTASVTSSRTCKMFEGDSQVLDCHINIQITDIWDVGLQSSRLE